MNKFISDFVITAEQTEKFFNIVAIIIKIALYSLPLIIILFIILKRKLKPKKENKYNYELKKLTACEKEYFKIIYKNFSDRYIIESQIYLRSLFPKMGAPNDRIDIVLKNKNNKPVLLIEINDETHNTRKLRKLRDVELKKFCNKNNIKLQTIWTRYDINEKSITNLIEKKLIE